MTSGLDSLQAAISRLQRMFTNRRVFGLAAAVAGIDLSQQAMQVLTVVAQAGPLTLGDVAHRARMDAGAVSRQIRPLLEAELVQRREGPGNSVIVEATPAGAAMVADFQAVRDGQLERALADWTDAERQQFAELMERFVNDVSATPYRALDVADAAVGGRGAHPSSKEM